MLGYPVIFSVSSVLSVSVQVIIYKPTRTIRSIGFDAFVVCIKYLLTLNLKFYI